MYTPLLHLFVGDQKNQRTRLHIVDGILVWLTSREPRWHKSEMVGTRERRWILTLDLPTSFGLWRTGQNTSYLQDVVHRTLYSLWPLDTEGPSITAGIDSSPPFSSGHKNWRGWFYLGDSTTQPTAPHPLDQNRVNGVLTTRITLNHLKIFYSQRSDRRNGILLKVSKRNKIWYVKAANTNKGITVPDTMRSIVVDFNRKLSSNRLDFR